MYAIRIAKEINKQNIAADKETASTNSVKKSDVNSFTYCK